MSVLENFKNIPRSPYGGRQGLNVIFFLQICNEVPGEKKKRGACRPLEGRQAPSPLFFFLQGLLCKLEEKKITFEPCRSP